MSTDIQLADLTRILEDHLGKEIADIGPDTQFNRDLDLDSLGLVEFVMAVEDATNLKIGDDALDEIVTIADLLRVIGTAEERSGSD